MTYSLGEDGHAKATHPWSRRSSVRSVRRLLLIQGGVDVILEYLERSLEYGQRNVSVGGIAASGLKLADNLALPGNDLPSLNNVAACN